MRMRHGRDSRVQVGGELRGMLQGNRDFRYSLYWGYRGHGNSLRQPWLW